MPSIAIIVNNLLNDTREFHLASLGLIELKTIICGAGINGIASALWLKRAGVDVTLVDQKGPAAGTSFGN
ncbi:MAG: FAD-dependent oxidoreductase, partial [Planktomarina sp.]|nr:FAD-dependent oxidoreductase [Planktomarina sp.]